MEESKGAHDTKVFKVGRGWNGGATPRLSKTELLVDRALWAFYVWTGVQSLPFGMGDRKR